MNDFTKEELESIKDSIERDYYVSNLSRDFYEPLISKIQFMIDNYCVTCEYMRKDQGHCDTIGCTAK